MAPAEDIAGNGNSSDHAGSVVGNPLGDFLRSRRERLSPAEVGLPGGGRRRTPGLRREELATLAGISVDYLVRLEQGRETRPSPPVVAALAETLQLDGDERMHLKQLSYMVANPNLCSTWQPPPSPPVSSTTLALLDRLDPTPAVVMEYSSELSAWNKAYERLMSPTGLLDWEPPNLLRYTFLAPAARELFKDWSTVAREQVGNLRSLLPAVCGDNDMAALIGDLSMNSPEFAQIWAALDVAEKRRGTTRLAHPVVGDLTLDYEALLLPEGGERRLVSYLPADDATAIALEKVVVAETAGSAPASAASPGTGRLRLVNEG